MDIDTVNRTILPVIPQPQTRIEPKQAPGNRVEPGQQVKEPEKPTEQEKYEDKQQSQITRREEKASASMLQAAIDAANKQLVNANRMIQASIHEKTNRIAVKIIDTETEEIVREIPPERTLDIFAKVLEMAGLLYDEVK